MVVGQSTIKLMFGPTNHDIIPEYLGMQSLCGTSDSETILTSTFGLN